MEYPTKGEFFDYIVKRRKLNQNESAFFFYQIVNGVDFLHQKNISHRDLKPENLLLDENNIIKIIDFGLSNSFDDTHLLKTPCGSPCYAAPEMLDGRKYSGATIDVWSMGIILFAMVCGYLPFEDPDNSILFQKIRDCNIDIPKKVPNLCLDMLKSILVSDTKERVTISQIKKHELYLLGESIYKNQMKIRSEVKDEKIENLVLEKMKSLGINIENLRSNLEKNEMNSVQATYLILYKKFKKETASKKEIDNTDIFRTFESKKTNLENLKTVNVLDRIITEPSKMRFNKTIITSEERRNLIEKKQILIKKNKVNFSPDRVSPNLDHKRNPKLNTFLYNLYSNSKPNKLKFYLHDMSSSRKDGSEMTNRDNLSSFRNKQKDVHISFQNQYFSRKKENNFKIYKKNEKYLNSSNENDFCDSTPTIPNTYYDKTLKKTNKINLLYKQNNGFLKLNQYNINKPSHKSGIQIESSRINLSSRIINPVTQKQLRLKVSKYILDSSNKQIKENLTPKVNQVEQIRMQKLFNI